MKERCFCIADIHGRLHALNQVLNAADFRNDKDRLIQLGDIVDGGSETRRVINRLLEIENRIDITGNHDVWTLNWMKTGKELPIWVHQGGEATMRSYDFNWKSVPSSHVFFLESQIPYYIDDKNRIYVHGGFNPLVPIENQTTEFITWDRTLIKYAMKHPVPRFSHVFVGHSTTQLVKPGVVYPLTFNNLTMCDTGGGFNGRLSIINVDNPEETYSSKTQRPVDEPRSDDEFDDMTEEFSWR
jgi:serine/threonine protein phosphatase 1